MIILPSLLLCFAFRLTREFNQLLILLITYWSLFHLVWHNPYKIPLNKPFLTAAIAILLPANIILHNVLKERGIISRHGLLRLLGTVIQIILLAGLLWFGSMTMHRPLGIAIFSMLEFKGLQVPQLALLGFMAALAVISVKTAFNLTTLNINQFIFAIACVLLLQYSHHEIYATLFLCTAALSVLFAILLNSYSLAYLDELTSLPSRRGRRTERDAWVGNRSRTRL